MRTAVVQKATPVERLPDDGPARGEPRIETHTATRSRSDDGRSVAVGCWASLGSAGQILRIRSR